MKTPETQYAKGRDGFVAYQAIADGPLDLVFIPDWVTNLEVMWEERTRERMESGGQIFISEISHAAEDRLGELLADHRRRLEQSLLPLGQAVDPRCENTLHGHGHRDLF